MNLKQVTVLSLVAELIFPILGYFFWNWDYSFILLYYAFDWFFFLIFQFIKIRKRLQLSSSGEERKAAINAILIYLGAFVICIPSVLYVSGIVDPEFSFSKRFIAFMNYQDMGIKQGYLIVPLCFFNAYNGYKRQFLLQRLSERFTVSQILRNSIIQHFVLTSAVLIICTIIYFAKLHPNTLLVTCVFGVFFGKAYFQLYKNQL